MRSSIAGWVLRVVLCVLFLNAGAEKFSDSQLWTRIFDGIGFGAWFRQFTGAVEIVGALLLLIRRATLVAVGLLTCTMLGALLVHVLVIGVGPQTGFVVLLLVLLLAVAALHLKRRPRATAP